MGVTYYIVNVSKREYFDPSRLGENSKRRGLLRGLSGHALGMLLLEHTGCWCGDRIVALGDGETSPAIENLIGASTEDAQLFVQTAYADVTQDVIALIAVDKAISKELVELSENDSELLAELKAVAYGLDVQTLQRVLSDTFGFSK